MANLFLTLFLLSILGLIIGLISPTFFGLVSKRNITRKKIGLIFGIGIITFFVLFGITVPPASESDEAVNKEIEQQTASLADSTEENQGEQKDNQQTESQEETSENLKEEAGEEENNSGKTGQPEEESSDEKQQEETTNEKEQQETTSEAGYLVTEVIDGDTIEIEGGQKVRYIGIDTPETKHPSKPVECFGQEASNKNKELVEGEEIRMEKDVSETDQYGRLLRYVWVGDTFVNDYLVRQGYAYASTYPPDVKYSEQFQEAQKEARENDRGLWSACEEEETTEEESDEEDTQKEEDGSKWYVSSYWSSEYYYCEESDQWKDLSKDYLEVYSSEEELKEDYPDHKLHESCY